MKKLMYVKKLSKKQFAAAERIRELEKELEGAKTVAQLKNAIVQARKVWNWNFQTEELMNPDPTWVPAHEEIYVRRLHDLGYSEEKPAVTNINITVEKGGEAVFKFKNNTFRWV